MPAFYARLRERPPMLALTEWSAADDEIQGAGDRMLTEIWRRLGIDIVGEEGPRMALRVREPLR